MDRVDYEKILVQDLVNFNRVGELNIKPWYQRRSVWTRPQKAYLINSLVENKPIPSLYIRHSLDIDAEKSIKEVVDGQQRVRAILEYVNGDFAARHPNHKKRVKYQDLSRTERASLKMTSLSVGYLLGADDSDVIEIFGRLNSVAKTLNEQEKRNARFSGEFKQFCLRQAAERVQLWRDLRVFTANDIARMNEVQFIADLTLNMMNGLSDYSSRKLNKIYEEYDETFQKANVLERRMEKVFARIAGLDQSTIKDTIFRRQPLFFSLCVFLDSTRRIKFTKTMIENALYKIDENFNSDIPLDERKRADLRFYNACTASTQRIRSRRIRDRYLSRALGIR